MLEFSIICKRQPFLDDRVQTTSKVTQISQDIIYFGDTLTRLLHCHCLCHSVIAHEGITDHLLLCDRFYWNEIELSDQAG